MSLLAHVHALSETIGPRGSATEQEAQATAYVEAQLTTLSLHPRRERLLSPTSAYSPYLVATGGVLLSLFLYWQPQPVGAAAAFIVTLVALVSVVRELAFDDNPLRWIVPTDYSHNTAVTIGAQQATLPPVLITAHVDTRRTPLFGSPSWRRFFSALVPVGLVGAVILLILFAIGIVIDARGLRQIALAPGAVVLALFLLLVQAARSPLSNGANDNGSGVAVALDLAEKLREQPLQKRDVVVVFTGCKEVGAYGVDAYVRAHQAELQGAVHFVIDHVGGVAGHDDGPSVVRSERFFKRAACDRRLLSIAEAVSRDHPNVHARSHDLDHTYTEMTVGAKHNLRLIALSSPTGDGVLPDGRAQDDVMANLNETTLQRSADFAWQFLKALDADAA